MPAQNAIFLRISILEHTPLGVYTLDDGEPPPLVKTLSLLCPHAVTNTRIGVATHKNDGHGPANAAPGHERAHIHKGVADVLYVVEGDHPDFRTPRSVQMKYGYSKGMAVRFLG